MWRKHSSGFGEISIIREGADKLGDIARILVYGDIHLCSKNYGAHNNYAEESLDCFRKITKAVEETEATHLIGLGDLTYGRFNTLEYREAVESEMLKQFRFVRGKRYELKGNDDSASYGMTEYEYYIKKGLINRSENLDIGENVKLTMVDYGKHLSTIPNIGEEGKSINVILAHDYFKFNDTYMNPMGKYILLDNFEKWFGADYIICGHIHTQHSFDGVITKNIGGVARGHRAHVQYLGALTRPSYREGHIDTVGNLALLTVKDTGELEYTILNVELPSIEESFNIAIKEAEKRAKQEKRLDISDIINQLNSHERHVGNPEDIILNMKDIPEKYKNKAIELLKCSEG